jgi:hypothetical protein
LCSIIPLLKVLQIEFGDAAVFAAVVISCLYTIADVIIADKLLVGQGLHQVLVNN